MLIMLAVAMQLFSTGYVTFARGCWSVMVFKKRMSGSVMVFNKMMREKEMVLMKMMVYMVVVMDMV